MPARRILKNNRGIALIVAILVMSLLIPMCLHFITSTLFQNISAANLGDSIKGECAARSGFNYALAVLYEDALTDAASNGSDSLKEPWADLAALNTGAASLFEETRLEIRITDLSGKININRLVIPGKAAGEDKEGLSNKTSDDPKKKKDGLGNLNKDKLNNDKDAGLMNDDAAMGNKFDEAQRDVLTRLLNSTELDLEEEEVENIVSAIKDWIDADDEVTEEWGLGAESSYYQGLDKPYSCRNGPLRTLGELLLIKGITKEIYSAISGHITVYGDESGKININTAGKTVLKSLAEDMKEDEADAIIEYREEVNEEDLIDIHWYQKPLNTLEDVIKPDLLTTQSKYFEVISTGSKGAMKKQIRAVVGIEGQLLTVVSWKIEDG